MAHNYSRIIMFLNLLLLEPLGLCLKEIINGRIKSFIDVSHELDLSNLFSASAYVVSVTPWFQFVF